MNHQDHYIYCNQTGKFLNLNDPHTNDLCCNMYRPRTRWVESILPPLYDNEQYVANKFPFWGLWRTSQSPPLPRVFYPGDLQPLGMCNSQFYGSDQTGAPSLLTPNWAFTK